MIETFTCDYIQFKEEGIPFDPLSDENLTIISLDASLSSDLDWKDVNTEATKILWNLSFDLPSISLYNSTALASFLVAIKTFTEELFLPHQESSFGVCLYQGPLLIPFKWNLEHEEAFAQWNEGYAQAKELYCTEIFSEYLHRLAAALPDEALPIALFDPIGESEARMAQLLSREHFSYLYVGLNKHPLPLGPFSPEARKARVGITLPLHTYCSDKSFKLVDACIEELRKSDVSFRIVSESHLTESWDGLDTLILFADFLSAQGKRKAQGFVAAGGQLVIQGNPINLSGEISWDEFRGRGI